jgi:hypothetical protein
MSQVIDLCEDSDDNGEWPNTVPVPPLPLIRKRPRDKEESSNDALSAMRMADRSRNHRQTLRGVSVTAFRQPQLLGGLNKSSTKKTSPLILVLDAIHLLASTIVMIHLRRHLRTKLETWKRALKNSVNIV